MQYAQNNPKRDVLNSQTILTLFIRVSEIEVKHSY